MQKASEDAGNGQEGPGRPHGIGGDRQPFDRRVGVVAQDGPSLTVPGSPLGAVADDEAALVVTAGVQDREPLAAGPEAAATPAA
jgi:hypothetical protein